MTDPEIFIVRVWRQLAAGFRASARRVDEEEAQFFSRPEAIARFLGERAGTADVTPGDSPVRASSAAHTGGSKGDNDGQ